MLFFLFTFGLYFYLFEADRVEQADEVDITDIPISLHGSSHVTRPHTLELEIDEELADTAPLLLSTSAGSTDSSLLQI